jgi:hypothetical protein
MAVYKTDRQRRILGDRLVARGKELGAIHPAVAEVHRGFTDVHGAFQHALEERLREEGEDALARERREEAVAACARLYSWAYHQVDALLRPSWDAADPAADPAAVRERLFPLGNPTAAAVSLQLTLDGMTHFLAAARREPAVAYPPEFLAAAGRARDELLTTVAAVTRDGDETRGAAKAAAEGRERWDTCFNALRDVTSGFLRLQGRLDRLDVLFSELPPSGAGAAGGVTGEAAIPAPGAETAAR